MDVLLHLRNIRIGQRLQGGESGKERRGHLIHSLIGTLGGQTHREQQFVIFFIVQRADPVGIELLERIHNGAHLLL
jgi:hypothetical protein